MVKKKKGRSGNTDTTGQGLLMPSCVSPLGGTLVSRSAPMPVFPLCTCLATAATWVLSPVSVYVVAFLPFSICLSMTSPHCHNLGETSSSSHWLISLFLPTPPGWSFPDLWVLQNACGLDFFLPICETAPSSVVRITPQWLSLVSSHFTRPVY